MCRRRGWSVRLADEFDVEDKVGLGGDDGGTAGFAVGKLVGDEEATLAADVHALEAGIPAGDDLASAVGEGNRSAAVDGGVELGAVGEPGGVVDCVVLALFGEGAGADDGVDVAEGVEGFGGSGDFGNVRGGVFGVHCRLGRSSCGGVVYDGLFGRIGGLCDRHGGEGGEESEGRQFQGHRGISLGDFRENGGFYLELWCLRCAAEG